MDAVGQPDPLTRDFMTEPSKQVHLPRFSDARDIDEFVEKLAAFESGAIGPEQFRAFRLTRGVYGQRQDGTQMLRVKLPMGRVSAEQLNVLAGIADDYSRGFGHVTTRQNVQFHFMAMRDAEAAMRRLDDVGITTREACGNSVRTVTACAISDISPDAVFDVRPWAEAVTRYFLGHRLAATLPRKFKIAFSGCTHDCAAGAINDIGLVAAVQGGQQGFKVLAAGGLSTSPEAALTLHEFVPAGELARVSETILRLFDTLGNRDNKHRARLKYVRRKLGEAGFRAKYDEIYAEVVRDGVADLAPAAQVDPAPASPVVTEAGREASPELLAWRAGAIVAQKQAGWVFVHVRLVLGDATSTQMRALGDIATRFGNGTLTFTIDQNIVLPWVDARSVPALFAELSALDLARTGIHTARDVTSCPGAETCSLAVTASRSLADAVMTRLDAPDAVAVRDLGTTIKISGCPHSCGQHHIADLGWHGGAKTVDGVTVPVYQLHLGGGVDARGAKFGRQVVKIVARRVPDAVVSLLELYRSERAEGEGTSTFFQRVDPKRVVAALAQLLSPPEASDRTDIGEAIGFKVTNGVGECAA
jgi:sulfite reductase beta subunit-like hemoprotein